MTLWGCICGRWEPFRLLNRQQELALAMRLETLRAAIVTPLSATGTPGRVVDTFELIRAGKLAIDPMIDVVASAGA